jgi:hypothetical protein
VSVILVRDAGAAAAQPAAPEGVVSAMRRDRSEPSSVATP